MAKQMLFLERHLSVISRMVNPTNLGDFSPWRLSYYGLDGCISETTDQKLL